jgi:hypothetical protein
LIAAKVEQPARRCGRTPGSGKCLRRKLTLGQQLQDNSPYGTSGARHGYGIKHCKIL